MAPGLQGDSMLSPSRFCSRRVFYILLFVLCLQIVLFASLRSHYPAGFPFASSSTKSPQGRPVDSTNSDSPSSGLNPPEATGHADSRSFCDATNKSPDVLVVVKTGANVIYERLPTQLMTMLKCYVDILFFSDLEQNLGPYQIHDALDNVTESVKSSDEVFNYYRTLQEYHKMGLDISTLKGTTGKAAWNLDRYKFLHMLEKTWRMQPSREWYVFIEADTYLVRTNLLQWLALMDPSLPHFLGSPTFFAGDSFPHGGSGFILSGVALAQFAEGDPGVAARYDDKLEDAQFGDRWLMRALRDKGVEFSRVWPMLQAESPSTIPYGAGPGTGARHWCQPIVSMHHVTSAQVDQIWQYETGRPDFDTPLLIQDIFDGLVSSRMSETIENWDNISDDVLYKPPEDENRHRTKPADQMTDVEKEAHLSAEHCNKACAAEPRCYQTLYAGTTCGFSFSFRLGTQRMPQEDRMFRSSFNMARIEEFRKVTPCTEPEWIL